MPLGGARVDLAVTLGVPSLAAVADAILAEIEVEMAVIATKSADSPAGEVLGARFPGATTVGHEEFKQFMNQARFVVRTGDATPCSNVIVRCGVHHRPAHRKCRLNCSRLSWDVGESAVHDCRPLGARLR